ncbi:phosphoglycolate phosphatase [Lutibacter agarilyticus]|uniref:phosphoglycolate phosphatase n=1 Tax=Lutibacter agarilyticus TaxID=1109740 RepID=A0A238VUS1_9FLAO|nr:HAD family hydrolase [Lutibacter agarilyticus]SNR37563.1 phosphoglycolate phosphatase [Lutibacter agarilyticus]
MKYKAVIFDLDGTLVDSLYDISDAMNMVLERANFPTHSYKDYQNFIGSGIRSLVVKSLPSTHQNESQIEKYFDAMIEVYRDNCTHKTTPYEGIGELLDSLVSHNLKLSVLSNKADEFTKKIVAAIFPNYFNPVLGLTDEALKKPHPFGALEICKNLDLKAEEVLYVGDTDVDMQTAKNANMIAVGVLWGYRSKEELILSGANYILCKPLDLIDIL